MPFIITSVANYETENTMKHYSIDYYAQSTMYIYETITVTALKRSHWSTHLCISVFYNTLYNENKYSDNIIVQKMVFSSDLSVNYHFKYTSFLCWLLLEKIFGFEVWMGSELKVL